MLKIVVQVALICFLSGARAEVGTEGVNSCLRQVDAAYEEVKNNAIRADRMNGGQLCRLVEARHNALGHCLAATNNLVKMSAGNRDFSYFLAEVEATSPEDASREIAEIESRWNQSSFLEQRKMSRRIRALRICFIDDRRAPVGGVWQADAGIHRR